MKKSVFKVIALTLVIVLALPLLSFTNEATASAKQHNGDNHSKDGKWNKKYASTVSFTKKKLTNDEDAFMLSLNNIGNNVKSIKWYSLNKKIATVETTTNTKEAKITPVKKGTTYITVKIIYKNGIVIFPTYKVKVTTTKVSATSIKINNAKIENGRHRIMVGKSYDFNSKLTPDNTQDSTYWVIDNKEFATVDSKGVVTGLKTGIVFLTAIAAKREDLITTSVVRDTIPVEIVAYQDDNYNQKTFNVTKVEFSDSARLVITFDKAITSNTVMDRNNNLLNAIVITPKSDSNNMTANTPGKLTGGLSSDGKILTIYSANVMKGLYRIRLTSALTSIDGYLLKEYNTDISLYDVKSQAKIISLEQTSYNTLTATFDRAIQIPGWAILNSTLSMQGVIDSKDLTKVNYTVPSEGIYLTGYQKVAIGYWDSYNVWPNDNSADVMTERYVNFSLNQLLPLPAPISVSQSLEDNSIVYVQFYNTVDKATAENRLNYVIKDATILSAELTNTSSGSTVKLTLQQGTIPLTKAYSVTISGIKGYNNSYAVMNPYQTTITLKENLYPNLISSNYISPTTIVLNFNEEIAGTPSFAVLQNNIDLVSYSVISGNTIIIILKTTPALNQEMKLTPTVNNVITDLAGNKVIILTRTIIPTL